jgi:rare lipoprotein A
MALADNSVMNRPTLRAIVILGWLVPATLSGCGSTAQRARQSDADAAVGSASYYAHRFHGRKTASGEIYDERAMTAAHPSLPHGTRVRVTNLGNGRSVVLRVNDRGPWTKKRLIDVSFAAAQELRFVRQGLARVRIEIVAKAD